MNPALAARVGAAVAQKLFVPVELRAPVGAGFSEWRSVQGQERRGFVEQQPAGFVASMVTDVHDLHLLASDFPDGRPQAKWQVRFADGRVLALSEPARAWDAAAQFLTAPLVPL